MNQLVEDMVFREYVLNEEIPLKKRYYGIYYILFCLRTRGNPVYNLHNLSERDIDYAVSKEEISEITCFVIRRILILLMIADVNAGEMKNYWKELLNTWKEEKYG